MKKTKIIATIGPASEKLSILTNMVKAGMNVARLNFSHGTHQNHKQLYTSVRSVSKRLGISVAILQDLQGPKIRIKNLAKPLKVKKGTTVTIGKDFDFDAPITSHLKAGHRILIEDGLVELVVKRLSGKLVVANAQNSGTIQEHKGVNVPDTHLTLPVLTEKDLVDLKFGVPLGVDYVALSFVHSGKDIAIVKRLIQKYVKRGQVAPKVIAKIERAAAVKNIDGIIAEADCIMVARGDLGVEIPESQVPIVQKNIIKKCLQAAKPVIVATQMLDSMIRNPRPTRAEVSDVANAVIDRADAVMLSGETAFGKYPLECVTEMAKIISATEHSSYAGDSCVFVGTDSSGKKASAISDSACRLAESSDAAAIISATDTGFTARFLSHQRPSVPIVLLTDKERIFHQLALYWGVTPLLVKRYHAIADLLKHSTTEAKKSKLVKKDDKVIVVAGNPIGQKVNMLEVKSVQ